MQVTPVVAFSRVVSHTTACFDLPQGVVGQESLKIFCAEMTEKARAFSDVAYRLAPVVVTLSGPSGSGKSFAHTKLAHLSELLNSYDVCIYPFVLRCDASNNLLSKGAIEHVIRLPPYSADELSNMLGECLSKYQLSRRDVAISDDKLVTPRGAHVISLHLENALVEMHLLKSLR